MRRFSELKGKTVLALDEGALLGKLNDFQFDLNDGRIYGYKLKGSGMFGRAGGIRADRLLRVGRDVAFVQSLDQVEWGGARNQEEGRAWVSKYKVRVMDRRGTMFGDVDDLAMDSERVLALLVGDKVVPVGARVVLGSGACVVEAPEVVLTDSPETWAKLTGA